MITLSIRLDLEEEHAVSIDIDKELDIIINNIQKNNISIQWESGEPCLQILQPLALRRIINNLLSNAIRYGNGNPVSVNYECHGTGVIIQIIDSGPGIPLEKIEKVFRPFYCLEHSRGSVTGGSGLGLAIVK